MATQVQIGHTLITARTWREERLHCAAECKAHRESNGYPTDCAIEDMCCHECAARPDCPVLGRPARECW
jgi:hypothetical protein